MPKENNRDEKKKLLKRKPRTSFPKRGIELNKKDHFETTKTLPNYKDVLLLRRFLSDKFKINSISRTSLSAKNQRKLAIEIKKARYMGLLPYTDLHSQL
jgi:small subunit ribosomal protein S18